jgi:ABC-type molybdate transport system substrate-binding protein
VKPAVALATLVAGLLIAAAALSGCGGPEEQTLRVFADRSLSGVFPTLGREFEASHHGEKVSFTFGGSDLLARRVAQGSADVFAAAGEEAMRQSGVPTSRVFARDARGGDYLIGAARTTTQLALAREFIDLVLSDQGRRALAGAGFTPV